MAVEHRGPAYNPETQAIVVRRDQERGLLEEQAHSFYAYYPVDQYGLKWIMIQTFGEEMIHLLSDDCNMELLTGLRRGDVINEIISRENSPIGADGDLRHPIALVTCESGILYKSAGFDLERYVP